MRQVFLDKGLITVRQVAEPLLDDYTALVAVHYSFISSGTEIATIAQAQAGLFANVPHKVKKVLAAIAEHGIEGTQALIKGKMKGDIQSLGYSCSGQVLACGKYVKRIAVGDWVACAGAGYAHHADLIAVPENLLVRVDNHDVLKQTSITALGAIALQGVRQAQLQLGEQVCVIGLGLLGQLTVQLAKRAGCFVIGIDLIVERLQLAKTLGADQVYHGTEDAVGAEIAFITHQRGVDATIITAASKGAPLMQQAVEWTRKKGRVIVVGDVDIACERDPLYKNEIDLRIACSYGPGRYDQKYEHQGHDYPYAYVRWTENRNMETIVRMVENKTLVIDPLISQEIAIDEVASAYAQIKKRELLGVVLTYDGGLSSERTSRYGDKSVGNMPSEQPVRFKPAVKDTIRVGFIGVGGFAKIKLLPLVSRIAGVKINAIVDADASNSLSIARVYGAARALTHDDEMLRQNLVDAVVIASPHKFHCEQIIKALEHGKAVFVEKPLVTSFDQLARMRSFLQAHPDVPLCVDFNRSSSPFMKSIKEVVRKRHSPLMVHYRMNAGYIAQNHWVQTDIGAGRIIGEACHIIELFCFLIDALPVSISVESMQAGRNDIFPTDNFSAQIRFADGSLCTLFYTALGNNKLGKERMELFYDSKAIVMDDYEILTGYGLPSRFDKKTSRADKGHAHLLDNFFNALKTHPFVPPITLDHVMRVSELTLILDQLACAGGGNKDLVL